MKALLLLLVSSLWVEVVRADDWFWIDAKINGKPVRLVLDTGCDPHLVLFRDTAQRLRLKLQEAKTVSGRWITEESTVKLPWSFWGFARASEVGRCGRSFSSVQGGHPHGWSGRMGHPRRPYP